MGVFVRDDGPAPKLRRARAAAWGQQRSILASAQRINLTSARPGQFRTQAVWQKDAWTAYNSVGEVHQGYNLSASLLSRVRIYVGVVGDTNEAPANITTDKAQGISPQLQQDAQRILNEFTGVGFPSMVIRFSLNLHVAGEMYLVHLPPARAADALTSDDEKAQWVICSSSELQPKGNGTATYRPHQDAGGMIRELPASTYIARIWRQHPQYGMEPDSALRALGNPVEELLLLDRLVRTYILSRLNAGLLFVPDGVSVPGTITSEPPIDEDVDIEDLVNASIQDPGNRLVQELMEAVSKPILDESNAANIVPTVLTGPENLGAAIRHIQFERTTDQWIVGRSDKALDRVMNGMDIPKEVITGMQQVKYALSTDAQIMTRRGWKTYEEVLEGEDVYTLNHDTGMGEWQPLQEINIHDHDGPMLRIHGQAHNSLSTPEHRWAIVKTGRKVAGSRRRWTTSADGFSGGDRVQTAAVCANLPVQPKWSDDVVQLVALYASDGWVEHPERGRPRANITKTSRNRRPLALDLAAGVVLRNDRAAASYVQKSQTPDGQEVRGVRWRLSPDASSSIFSIVESDDKIIRPDFITELTLAQLALLLDTFLDIGDGNIVNGNPLIRRYWQTDRRRLEPIALAAALAGWTVRWLPTPITPSASSPVQGSQPCWGLTVTKARTMFRPYSAEQSWEHYTGKVWCPTTGNHTWLARQNGTVFFTGNSNAVVIDDSLYKATIEPDALTLVDSLTDAYLRPQLLALGYKPEEISEIVVWYDPSEIVTRPNAAEDATEGYDRGVLSESAWRREHGFPESDAPDDEERLRWLVHQIKQLPPAALNEALKHLFGKVIDLDKLGELPPALAQAQEDEEAPGRPNLKAVDIAQPKPPPADPQATAIKQVGVK